MSNEIPLVIILDTGPYADKQYTDSVTRQLLQQVSRLDVEEVSLVRPQVVPQGAMGQPVEVGAIVATGVGPAISGLAHLLQTWVSRGEKRSITLKLGDNELTVSGVSKEQQAALIEEFLEHHRLIELPGE